MKAYSSKQSQFIHIGQHTLMPFRLLLAMILSLVPVFGATTIYAVTGTLDSSWYNDIDLEFEINNADQLAGLAQLINDGTDDFHGKTITLSADIDLSEYGKGWNDGKGWKCDSNNGRRVESTVISN
ncbi:MAG: hypothetical protein FWG53_00625 [Clostridiales bacterium]|nr:hypothetical protein [Clostridiales bacterium]